MMSESHFRIINPQKQIYISNYGENYQVQIPFLYNDLQGYLEKPLGQYTVRKDSYSSSLNTEKTLEALKGQEESDLETLTLVCTDDYEKYSQIFLNRIRADRFHVSLHCRDKKVMLQCLKEYKEVIDKLKFKDILRLIRYQLHLY